MTCWKPFDRRAVEMLSVQIPVVAEQVGVPDTIALPLVATTDHEGVPVNEPTAVIGTLHTLSAADAQRVVLYVHSYIGRLSVTVSVVDFTKSSVELYA